MELVKKTQKDWECSQCFSNISAGSSMFRKKANKWKSYIFCLKCGKPEIVYLLKGAKESFKIFKDYDKNNEVYQSFKKSVEYYENILKII